MPGGRHEGLCPEGLYGSYERDTRVNLKEGSFDLELIVLVPFSEVNRDRRATRPSALFAQNSFLETFQDSNVVKNKSKDQIPKNSRVNTPSSS